MFEITMLFAFLYAASCQLFPKRAAEASLPSRKKGQTTDASERIECQPKRGSCKKLKNPLKTKSRSHNYAYAA